MTTEVTEYVPLKGEGEVQYIKRTRVRRDCDVCGEPADYRHTHLLDGARRNPASSAYGKDDCSWCSDAETWSCAIHRDDRSTPEGYGWCCTFTLDKMPHLGLYYRDEKMDAPSTTPSIDDDGEALRLAVKLGAIVGTYESFSTVDFLSPNERIETITVWHHETSGDACAATRLAICRADAAIAKATASTTDAGVVG